VQYVNEKKGILYNLESKNPYETLDGTGWKYAYPVNGYKDEKIEEEKTNDKWKPKRGDIVEVSDDKEHWIQRIFLAEIEGATYPFVVVSGHRESEFKRGEEFGFSYFKFIRKPVQKIVQKTTLTKAQIAEKLNIPVEELEIIDQMYENNQT